MSEKRGFFDVIPTTFGSITIPKIGKVEIPMPQWFKGYLLKIQNYLKFLSFANLYVPNRSIPIAKLDIGEIHFPLCLPASNYTTTSTSGANIGAYFYWNPAVFPTGTWYLETSIATTGGTATLTLKGVTDIKTLTTTSSGMTNKREQVTMPATAQNLYLNLKVSSSSYTAALGGARLILIPQG
jgi:hypothetical protein